MEYGSFGGSQDRIVNNSSWIMNPDGSVSTVIAAPSVGWAMTGTQPVAASPGTNAGTFVSVTAPNGGNTSVVAVAGGTGGAFAFVGGNGGNSAITGTGTNTGGVGGALTFTAGNGGTATGGSIANNGGAGGNLNLNAGNGGASGISAGGSIVLTPGTATGGGTAGNVQIVQGGLTITAGGLTNAGVITSTGGVVSLNVSSNFAVNIATGTTNTAVTIGNSAVGVITIANKANTAATFLITDGTNNYHAIDTRTGVSGVFAHTIGGTAPSFASATTSAFTMLTIPAYTWTVTGGTGITTTNPGPLSLLISAPTLTSTSATAAALVSTAQINGPIAAGSGPVTAAFATALDLPTWNGTNETIAANLRISQVTAGGINYAIYFNGAATVHAAGSLTIEAAAANLTLRTSSSGTVAVTSIAVLTLSGATTATLNGTTSLALQSAIAIPSGGSTAGAVLLSSTAGFGIYFGSGVPTVSAAAGSLYIRTDNAGANLRLYSNTTGSTTWAAVTSA